MGLVTHYRKILDEMFKSEKFYLKFFISAVSTTTKTLKVLHHIQNGTNNHQLGVLHKL